MNLSLLFAASSLAACCQTAGAEAQSSIYFGSDRSQVSVSDPVFGTTAWWDAPKTLAPGETWTVSVNYTVELSSFGLPFERQVYESTNTFPTAYARPATGFESAEAYIYWVTDGRFGQFDDITLVVSTDRDYYIAKGQAAYSGTMTFTATNIGYEYRSIYANLAVGLFSDSNPIPEPTTSVMLLAGLAATALARRRLQS